LLDSPEAKRTPSAASSSRTARRATPTATGCSTPCTMQRTRSGTPLLRAWRALPTFQSRSSHRTWLYRIATNVCLDAIAHRPKRALLRRQPLHLLRVGNLDVPALPLERVVDQAGRRSSTRLPLACRTERKPTRTLYIRSAGSSRGADVKAVRKCTSERRLKTHPRVRIAGRERREARRAERSEPAGGAIGAEAARFGGLWGSGPRSACSAPF
jgi:Sigma-70 region 2